MAVDVSWLRWIVETIARSQDWWFAQAASDRDGMPEYTHPYSSGLDDSPIFDHGLPVASPDLAAYLVVQDAELARLWRRLGEEAAAERHGRRAERTMDLLLDMWDARLGYFPAYVGGLPVEELTAVSLLPLLTGGLPDRVVDQLMRTLNDTSLFASPFPVPTVALAQRSFSAERMWRGPAWVNINALLVEALSISGRSADATALAEQTVALVIRAGGPHEYFNPITGHKAPDATTSFGWSAALFVDLAVRLSR